MRAHQNWKMCVFVDTLFTIQALINLNIILHGINFIVRAFEAIDYDYKG